MKLSAQIAVTAVGVLIASAGVLIPIQQTKAGLEEEVASLQLQASTGVDVEVQIDVMRQEIAELEQALETRTVKLLPDTSEAKHAFESALQSQLFAAGLQRVSMDRQAGAPIGGTPTFQLDLVVEGEAKELHGFLVGLESLHWVSRVLALDVSSGVGRREITMTLAVPLEASS